MSISMRSGDRQSFSCSRAIDRTRFWLSWNISKAAVSLGVERTNLHKKIRAYGIKRGDA